MIELEGLKYIDLIEVSIKLLPDQSSEIEQGGKFFNYCWPVPVRGRGRVVNRGIQSLVLVPHFF